MKLRNVGNRVMAASAALLLLAAAPRAYAGTVTTNADSGAGSLRSIIAAAAAGETINFASSVSGTIALTSAELVISKNLTILGPGATLLEISGSNARRVFSIFPGSVVTISGLTITEGLAVSGAGIFNRGSLTLSNCVIFNNHTVGVGAGGGGIASDGSLSMSDCLVYLNDAAVGGAINIGAFPDGSGPVQITRCFFHSNNAGIEGGAIRAFGGNISINDSTFTGNGVNSSSGDFSSFSGILGGAALSLSGSGTAAFTNCTLSGNAVSASALKAGGTLAGGAIANAAGTLMLHNCTLADNQVISTSTVTTIPAQGGGIYNSATDGATATLGSTIVARNTATTGPDFRGPAISQGFNLIGRRDGSTGFTQATDLTGTVAAPLAPGLDAGLQDNGGPTPTILLLPGSPAIDKGKSFGTTTDQRGKTRPYNNSAIANAAGGDGSDIGAVEIQPPGVAVNNPASKNEGREGASGSVIFAVNLSAPSPQSVLVDFKTTNGTAIAGSDYVAKSGRLTFAPGETQKLVSVLFSGDTVPETNETLFFDLTSATNATLADSRGATSVKNDDGPGLSIDNSLVDEGNSGNTPQSFIVRLSAASTNTIKVDWATAPDTAGPTDFVAASGTLTFAPGQTSKVITVQVKGDVLVEPTETYKVNLSKQTFSVLADAQGVGTIRNDDSRAQIFENDEPSE